MGNAEVNQRAPRAQQSRYTRNSYSLEGNSYFSNHLSPAASIQQSSRKDRDRQPILLDNIAQLSKPEDRRGMSLNRSVQKLPKQQASAQLQQHPESTMQKSISASIAGNKQYPTIDLSNKLNKLTLKNDVLRKELIHISALVSSQLKNKKFVPKVKEREIVFDKDDEDPLKVEAIRRELENGYKEIDRVKKVIENSKKLEGNNSKNEDLLNEIEAKIQDVEWDIYQIVFEIKNAKEVASDIKQELDYTAGIADFRELEPFKKQIARLRKLSKKLFKNERVRLQKERVMQELMFQLERRNREINGDYLPEIKSYANKNYQPETKHEKKKDSDFANYKPADWEIRNVAEEIHTLKKKHEEYHAKMDKALKAKAVAKEDNERTKKEYEGSFKELEGLQYKKERYMQLVMGNVEYLMNEEEGEEDSEQSGAELFRTIIKGKDIPEQVFFNDRDIMKDMVTSAVKMVAINMWFTPKSQISVLQVVYSNGKDCFLGSKSSNVTGDLEKESFSLEEGDYIKNIMGISSRKGAIEYLAFTSSQSKAHTFGKEMINGLNFTLGLSRRERPFCISGYSFFDGSYWRINKLVIEVVKE